MSTPSALKQRPSPARRSRVTVEYHRPSRQAIQEYGALLDQAKLHTASNNPPISTLSRLPPPRPPATHQARTFGVYHPPSRESIQEYRANSHTIFNDPSTFIPASRPPPPRPSGPPSRKLNDPLSPAPTSPAPNVHSSLWSALPPGNRKPTIQTDNILTPSQPVRHIFPSRSVQTTTTFVNPQQLKALYGRLSLLNVAIEAMDLQKEVTGIGPANVSFGSVSALLTMIRDHMADKTEWVELGLRYADVCRALERGINRRKRDDISQDGYEVISQLVSTVAEIQRKAIKCRERNAITRRLRTKSDREAIAAWTLETVRFLHIFNSELLIHTHTVAADPGVLPPPDKAPIGASRPSATHPTPDLSTLACLEASTCKRLVSHDYSLHELISLIEDIFTRKDEVKMVGYLGRDAAQAFIDVVHEALDLPDLPPRLRRKCLTALCWLCGRHALLPESLQIPVCYNRSDTPLYCGGFGDVWKGEHQGRPVAVKVLRVYSTSDFDKIISRFSKEVVTWSALRHPNVLPLLGVTMETHHFAMASEWMVNGNINEFIKTHRDSNRFELLQDVARGLIYMHGQAMIHGDLKGANILVDKDRHARLADFGLLTIISDPTNFTASSSHVKGGTTRWMSPEILNPDLFGFKDSRPTNESDCYALGMVILEVLSGQPPFTLDKDFIVMRKVTDGERPGRPEGPEGGWFTDDLWRMLELCWATRPDSRPSIEAVLECLERVSGTWEPPSQRVDEDVGTNRDDLDYSIDSLYQALDPL